jgi:4-carboxymuconolactone decarboxylase
MVESRITDAGRRAAEEMIGADGPAIMEANAERWATRVDENWSQLITGWVVNGHYARAILPTSVRELCAVAGLAILGREHELESHIRIALQSNPPEAVREVLLQMAVYGGVPVALDGMRVFERVMAEAEDDGPPPAVR